MSATDVEEPGEADDDQDFTMFELFYPELKAQVSTLRITGLWAQPILRKVCITTNKGK